MRLTLLAVLLCGCLPVVAPPVRGLHAGMPGVLSAAQVEVGAAVGATLQLTPHIAVGLTDHLSIEAGPTLSSRAATGWAGARVTFEQHQGIGRKSYGDVELGTGGGTTFANPMRDVGLYGGFGLGLRQAYFGMFARARVEWTRGEWWPTAIAGVEMRVARHTLLGAAGGYAGAWLPPAFTHGVMGQVFLRYYFDVPR